MNFTSIYNYLTGYVRVRVNGSKPERLINLCLSSGFPIWDVEVIDGQVQFSTSLSHYKKIRNLARKSHCIPKVVARKGLPFIVGKIRRRPLFLAVAFIAFLVYLYLSGGVWMIVVKGENTVSRETILNAAAKSGVFIGARKSLISTDKVEKDLLIQIPELSWAYVYFKGSLAVIEVVEKVRPEVPPPGDVVAKKEGVIESMLILSGVPVVKPGQTVKAGEILIAGSPHDRNGAKGEVMAQTWYQVYNEIPLKQKKSYRTGRKIEMYVVRYGTTELQLFGTRDLFEWYEVEEYPTGIKLEGNGKTRFELIKRVLFEVKWEESEISVEEARILGEERGKAAINRQLPPSAKILDISSKVENVGENAVGVLVTFSTLEDIGEIRPWGNEKWP